MSLPCNWKKTIILIDEYDVLLENAYFRGFYHELVDFIRSLFESALKTNDCLQFAVITGCLRISKESYNPWSVIKFLYGLYFDIFKEPAVFLRVRIPNTEVRTIYRDTILN